MPECIRLIVGLGNPGTKYRDTWHNLGFKVVEILAGRWNISFKPGKGEYLVADTSKFGGATLLMPTTYMNRSGIAVGAWIRYFKVTPEQVLVVYDDHDLPFGSIRLRASGSAGGHNGMSDIIRSLQSESIPRLRIGIRTDSEFADLADQVLTAIPKRLEVDVNKVIIQAADTAESIVSRGEPTSSDLNKRLTVI